MPGGEDAAALTAQLDRFRETFLYRSEAFLVDELLRVDRERREVVGRLDTRRDLPIARWQRVGPDYPAHLTAGEIVHLTACVGSLHAWFFHELRWEDGWVGFGNRIHRADFRTLARVGPPLVLGSRSEAVRSGPRRLVLRYEFDFRQEDTPVYHGDQTAIFLRPAGEGRGADEDGEAGR